MHAVVGRYAGICKGAACYSSSTGDTRRILVLSALLFGWLAVGASAVDPGLPSKTSVLTASLRAIGAKNPDAAFRNPDYLAIKFLGPR